MKHRRWRLAAVMITVPLSAAGCYEDTGSGGPGGSAPAPEPIAGQNEGPITSAGQSSGSALGATKRTATGIIDRAEQKSREVGDQADEISDPNRDDDSSADE